MISERIKTLAKLIEDSGDLADIGSDHGYLLFELVKNGFSHQLLGVENKIGPYNALIKEINQINYQYKSNIKAILSDGIRDITKNYTNVVLAGMGLPLIKKIILSNKNKIEFIENFYIDCHTNFEDVRPFFINLGYAIEDEITLFENNIYYNLIHFKKATIAQNYNSIEMKYGSINIKKKEKTFIDFLLNKKEQLGSILKSLPENNKKRDEICKLIIEIEGILYEN